MLKLNNVSKKFPNFSLQDISFELPKGYIMGLIGENGAGKTTILNHILGLYQPNSGTITIDGMTYREQEKQIKNRLGYVLTDEIFGGELTLVENANMYGKYYEHYKQPIFHEYCRRFQLEETKKFKHLSKGEKLKFQFAFALSHQPKLLVLDEPTANFDPDFRKEFLQILTEFVSDGEKSVLLATWWICAINWMISLSAAATPFEARWECILRTVLYVIQMVMCIVLIKKEGKTYMEKAVNYELVYVTADTAK